MTLATLGAELLALFILAIPVACIAWTVTHEELFREIHQYCVRRSKRSPSLFARKLFYMLTCEFCFSFYVSIGALVGTGFQLLLPDWRGSVIAVFALVWVANHYMSVFARLRLDVKLERIEIEQKEEKADEKAK